MALHDALGSVRQTLDDMGDPLSPTGYAYTPFGVVRSGAEPAPFGFTSELHHDDLVYLRARWYDPASGTFLGRDPFAGFERLPYSLHPYQYAYSDPVRWTDPSGENPLAVPAAGLTALEIAFLLASGAITLTTLQVCVVQQQCDAIWDAWEGHKADVRRGFDYLTNRESYVWTGGGSATARTPPQGDNSLPPQIVTPPHGVAHPWPTIRSFPLPQETGAGCWLPFPLVNPTAGPLHTGFPLPQEPPVVVLASSSTLDRNLGGTTGDDLQAHHLIPEQFRTHAFVRRAMRAGWDHDQRYNGILLPDNPALSSHLGLPKHNGSHGPYNDRVRVELDKLESAARAGRWTDHQSHNQLQSLASHMESYIRGLGGGGKVR